VRKTKVATKDTSDFLSAFIQKIYEYPFTKTPLIRIGIIASFVGRENSESHNIDIKEVTVAVKKQMVIIVYVSKYTFLLSTENKAKLSAATTIKRLTEKFSR